MPSFVYVRKSRHPFDMPGGGSAGGGSALPKNVVILPCFWHPKKKQMCVILIQEKKLQKGKRVWNFPGGMIERGNVFQSACNELYEETRQTIKIPLKIMQKHDIKHDGTRVCLFVCLERAHTLVPSLLKPVEWHKR